MPFLGRNTGWQGVGGAAADPSRNAGTGGGIRCCGWPAPVPGTLPSQNALGHFAAFGAGLLCRCSERPLLPPPSVPRRADAAQDSSTSSFEPGSAVLWGDVEARRDWWSAERTWIRVRAGSRARPAPTGLLPQGHFQSYAPRGNSASPTACRRAGWHYGGSSLVGPGRGLRCSGIGDPDRTQKKDLGLFSEGGHRGAGRVSRSSEAPAPARPGCRHISSRFACKHAPTR